MTLQELAEAYKRGDPIGPMMLDNDQVSACIRDEDGNQVETVYDAHPHELLEQALDLLGIPHEPV